MPTPRRRDVLGSLGAGAGLLAGCSSPFGSSGPNPVVREHVRGRVTVTETTRQTVIGGPSRILASVRNSGHEAAVDVTLYWVPELGLEPTGLSDEALRDRGYELAATERIRLAGDDSATVRFERAQPRDAVGYYVRGDNLTFGAVVGNRGDPGPVRVTLIDTTDTSEQTVLAERRVRLEAGERQVLTFTTTAEFERFRVDATAVVDR